MSVAGLVDAEVATIHALGGRCPSCVDQGGCERSDRAREALAEWAAAARVRAGVARRVLELAAWGRGSAAGTGEAGRGGSW
jgi:hypothetical protein